MFGSSGLVLEEPFLEDVGMATLMNIGKLVSLNICHDLPEDSKLYTIDLPEETVVPEGSLDYDKMLVDSERRNRKKHFGCHNMKQIYMDSIKFYFSSIKFSGAFIDGGHAYSIVKSDSEKVIENIPRPGFIL